MTDVTTEPRPSLWSEWAVATDEHRTHFKTLENHRAWSRICSSCGAGDFLERKQMPSHNGAEPLGRSFPKLPVVVPLEASKARPLKIRRSAVHSCAPVGPRGR